MSREDVLVDADWVEAHLDDPKIVLVEVDEDTSAYDKNHIRGAVKIDWKADLQDPVRRDFIDKARLREAAVRKGISNDDTVDPVRRQQQLVRGLRVLVLQALRPRERQAARRRPQEVGARQSRARPTRPSSRAATSYKAKDAGHVHPRLPRRGDCGDRQAEPGRRPLARRVRRQAARPGAPAAGAVAARRPHPDGEEHPVEQGRQRRRHVPSRRRARTLYGDEGVDFGKDTIAYCRIGERSAHTWFVLHEILGQPNVKNYDGSWTEYGSLVGVPVSSATCRSPKAR